MKNILNERIVMDRKTFIGGSDIASVMGKSRWKSALQLWCEKTGKIEAEDISQKEAVEMGIELEDTVARLFTKRTGMKVRKSPKYYEGGDFANPDWGAFMKCQVDRLVEGTDQLLECKTCSAWKANEWEGEEIPEEYILQVQWQLGLTGRSVGWIAVLIGGQKFIHKKIDFDNDMYNNMVRSAIEFWKMVKEDREPKAVGLDNKSIVELHPDSDDQIQQFNEMNDSIGLLQQLKGNIGEMTKQKEEIEAGIKQVIGDNLGINTEEYIVTWKGQSSVRLDMKSFKEEHPDLYNQYAVPTSTRVMRVKKNKK